jgi:hypothetical protein
MNDLDCVGKAGGKIKALVHDSVSSPVVGTLAGPQPDQRDVTGSGRVHPPVDDSLFARPIAVCAQAGNPLEASLGEARGPG